MEQTEQVNAVRKYSVVEIRCREKVEKYTNHFIHGAVVDHHAHGYGTLVKGGTTK